MSGMTGLWQLSWRNLWRQRRRSLLTASVVAVAVLFSLVFAGFVGALTNAQYIGITRNVGHLSLRVNEAQNARAFRDSVIAQASAVKASLEQAGLPAGTRVVTTLEVPALLSGQERSRGVLLLGNDAHHAAPPKPGQDSPLGTLKEGRLPSDDEADAIALGAALAQALGVGLGDAVYAYAPNTEGLGQGLYRVVGLLSAPDHLAEGKLAYLPQASAQQLAAPDGASRLELHLPGLTHASDDVQVSALQRQLAAALPPTLALQTWQQAYPSLAALVMQMRPMTMAFSGLFFVLAGLLVVNTIYLSLLERTREFGVIIALGAGPGKVTRMVLLESLLLCGVGALLGLLPGLGVIAATAGGIPTSGIPSLQVLQGGAGMAETLYPSLLPGDILFALGFTLITALLAAWWPARQAAKLEPVEAMRFVA